MRIVSGSGHRRSATVLCGSTAGIWGRDNKSLYQTRRIAAQVLKDWLFPTNAAFHKAKRRGDKALSMTHANSSGLSLA